MIWMRLWRKPRLTILYFSDLSVEHDNVNVSAKFLYGGLQVFCSQICTHGTPFFSRTGVKTSINPRPPICENHFLLPERNADACFVLC